jgi:hypothetical protein
VTIRLVLGAALLGALCPAAAHAGYFPGRTVDGPSPLIERLAGVGLARDGSGSVAYEKRDSDGAVHVFAARLEHGNPLAPERVDAGQALDSSQARVAVARDGRTLVTWVNGGRLWGSQRPTAAEPFSEPAQIYAPGDGEEVREPSLGLSLHGVGYITFTVSGGGRSDVRSAFFEDGAWSVHGEPLDIEPARAASDSRLAASADGSALALWTEESGAGTRVFARRISRTRLSSAPRQVSVDSFEGRAGGSADSASLDIEDDSSYAWVAWRQDFDDGGTSASRVLMRRLRGGEFEEPVPVDSLAFGAGDGADRPEVDLSGRGRAIVGGPLRSGQIFGADVMQFDLVRPARRLGDSAGMPTRTVAAIAENGRGTLAWVRASGFGGTPQLVARYFNARRWENETPLSAPDMGQLDPGAGIDASADTEGNNAIAFVQSAGGDRRISVAVYDKEPRTTGGIDDLKWRRRLPRSLTWREVTDDWGGVRYRVEIDGIPVATDTTSTVVQPSRALGDGAHAWQVFAVDGRGQETEGPIKQFRVDRRAPSVSLRRAAGGVRLAASDGGPVGGSGVSRVLIRWGDGRSTLVTAPTIGLIENMKLRHRYRGRGARTVRATAYDRAGHRRSTALRVR